MSKKKYEGSCHCKSVSYEANLDLEAGTARCNCTYCATTRNWSVKAKPEDFKWISGESETSKYGFRNESQNHHYFCKNCGTTVCTMGYIEQTGGDFVSVRVATLNGISPEVLASIPIRYMDGLHDNWFEEPVIAGYL